MKYPFTPETRAKLGVLTTISGKANKLTGIYQEIIGELLCRSGTLKSVEANSPIPFINSKY